jgi:uncharacterized repeat protein (TIGR03803 family)
MGNEGYEPSAGVIFDQAGNLYGTTFRGGVSSSGTAFKLTRNAGGGWTDSVLYTFCSLRNCSDGGHPYAGLIFDQTGSLYGTTSVGGAFNQGTVFKLTPNVDGSWTESVLHSFCSLGNCGDGAQPYAGLVFDSAGNLYGATSLGGARNQGAAFKLAPNADGSWTESVLHSFCSFANCGDGAQPYADLIFDLAGNLYGTTQYAGGHASGVVFQLTPSPDGRWREKVLHHFTGGKDGSRPLAGVIFDASGNLYGTADVGGNFSNCSIGCGTVFQLVLGSGGKWAEKVLHNFKYNLDGANPSAGLIFDQGGNLYSTAGFGGVHGHGVVYKLSPKPGGRWRETVLHAFSDNPGASPVGGVVFDVGGNLYGTTFGEGSATFGTVFELTP